MVKIRFRSSEISVLDIFVMYVHVLHICNIWAIPTNTCTCMYNVTVLNCLAYEQK